MTKQLKIAVVGASTLVGEALLDFLQERKFPVADIILLDEASRAGGRIEFNKKQVRVTDISQFDFSSIELAFFVAGESVSASYVKAAAESGCIVIDRSPAFRLDPDVPLVVPEVNAASIAEYKNSNIIASPSAASIALCTVLKPISDVAGISRVNVTTLQAASGAGRSGLEELGRQTAALLNFQEIKTGVFSQQVAFNIIPEIGDMEENGYSREEMKLVNETRKVFQDDGIMINPTAVRVPVFYGHAATIHLETRNKLTIGQARDLLKKASGVELCDEEVPTPVKHAAGEDSIYIGRLREDISVPSGLDMWIVMDNLRKGAALNSVQIAEILVKHHL